MSISLLENAGNGTDDLDNVRNTTDENANNNSVVPANLHICPPTTEDGYNVCKEGKEKDKTLRRL